MELMSKDLLKHIFNFLTVSNIPILRLVNKTWNQLIDKRCVNLVHLLSKYPSIDLCNYLYKHKLTDFSNSSYIKGIVNNNSNDENKHECIKYLYNMGTPLTTTCIGNSIFRRDLQTLTWLIEKNCPIPKQIHVTDYNDTPIINYIKTFYDGEIHFCDYRTLPESEIYKL